MRDLEGFGFGGPTWEQMEEAGFDPAEVITPIQMRKRVIWDSVPCKMARDVMIRLKVTPGSDEVEAMEHRQSHERIGVLDPFSIVVHELSHHVAEAIVGAIMVGNEIPEDPEIEDEMIEKQLPVIEQGCRTVIAQLIDLNILHLPHLAYVDVEGGEPE